MPNWKCNLFFSDPTFQSGWSETYYNTADSAATVQARLDSLAGGRQQLLAGNVNLDAARYSDDGVFRDGFVFLPTITFSSFAQATADYDFVAAECRIYATLSVWRALYLRGVPDVLFNPPDDAAKAIAAQWKQQLTTYLASLTNPINGWAIKTYDKAAAQHMIAALTEFPNEMLGIDTVDAHGFNVGDYAHHTKIRTPSPRIGTSIVRPPPTGAVNNPNRYYVNGFLPRLFSYTGTGIVQKQAPLYPQITQANYVRTRHRDTGRPFAASRGRQASRK